MKKLTPEQEKKIRIATRLFASGEAGAVDYMMEIEDNVNEGLKEVEDGKKEVSTFLKDWDTKLNEALAKIHELKDGEPGKDAISPTTEQLLTIIKPLIPEANMPTNEQLLALITPLIPKIEAKDNITLEDVTNIIKGFLPIPIDLEVELPQRGLEIASALELLPEEEKLPISAIRGLIGELEAITKMVRERISFQPGGITGRDLIHDYDLSPQLNGVTATFNIPAVYTVVSVDLSSSPYGSLRKNVDYSYTPTSITFLSPIDPSTQLSAGQSCILTVVSA